MSATPRQLQPDCRHHKACPASSSVVVVDHRVGSTIKEDRSCICGLSNLLARMEAFDALLAVAKEAAARITRGDLQKLITLDSAFPGWLEWGEDTGKAYTQPPEGPSK
jgi:hypothetical protein